MNRPQPPVPRNLSAIVSGLLLPLLLLCSGSLAAQEPPVAATAEPAQTRPMISVGEDAEAIARKRPDTAVWLTGRDQRRVLALFQPERASPARGALVILADEGQSAASGLADALREPLSEEGWAVMTLGLTPPPFAVQQWLQRQGNTRRDLTPAPGEPSAEPPAAGEAASVMINLMDPETSNEALTAYREQVVSSLNAAIDVLQEREYRRVVLIGVGRAAGHVTRQVRADGRASNLIWIAPHFYPDEASGLTGLLAAATSPSILELHSTHQHDRALDRSATERAAALARAGIQGYRRQPVAMAAQPRPREARMLANRISSWLR